MGPRKQNSPTKKKRWRRIFRGSQFSLFRSLEAPHLFEISWKKSKDLYGRKRFNAGSDDEALAIAQNFNFGQDDGGGNPSVPSIAEAFAQALAQTKRGAQSRREWLVEQTRFMRWLAEHHPSCNTWDKLRREMVRAYITEVFPKRSANGIRLAIQPIVQTAGCMAREHHLPNIAERFGVGARLSKTPAHVYLPDVLRFLDSIREKAPRIEVGATLQGLAGLQLKEALRLTWGHVDWDRGLIEISGEVKNEYRNRVLPVCGRVLDSLRRAAASREKGVIALNEPVVRSMQGRSYVESMDSWKNYSHELADAITEWNGEIGWAPKDLRNCLPTFAATEGIHGDIWEQYLGHAPKSVTARHYIPRLGSKSHGESTALDRQMAIFRFHVIQPLEAAISQGGEGRILNFFEQAQNPVSDSPGMEGAQPLQSQRF